MNLVISFEWLVIRHKQLVHGNWRLTTDNYSYANASIGS